MDAYEIRLLNVRGETVLLYFTQCGSEAQARRSVTEIHNINYARYELWHGTRMICDGERTDSAALDSIAS